VIDHRMIPSDTLASLAQGLAVTGRTAGDRVSAREQ
jgi:hypothetical protein